MSVADSTSGERTLVELSEQTGTRATHGEPLWITYRLETNATQGGHEPAIHRGTGDLVLAGVVRNVAGTVGVAIGCSWVGALLRRHA